MTGTIPEALDQLDSLKTLHLNDNKLTGPIPEALGNLNNLGSLHLSGNQLTGCIPSALQSIPNNDLDDLGLVFCHLESGEAAILAAFYEATGGDHWTDNTNWLSGAPLSEWYGVTTDDKGRVTALDLSQNELTGPIPSALSQLDNLNTLLLSGNQLTRCIPSALQSIPNNDLDDLGLAFCLLDDWAPLAASYEATGGDHWTDNTNWLSEVPLNEWYGVTTDDKGRVTALDLSQNELTGPIPSALSQLDSLQTLNLSYNQLTGPIPSALGQLDNLWVLFLSGNQLTGCIPSALQDVSSNDLDHLGLASCLSEITPEIIGLYSTVVATFQNIFFAVLLGATTVEGEGGTVEVAGYDWTFQDFSPDGALIVNGALQVGIDQTPIPLTGTINVSGAQEAEVMLNMAITIGDGGSLSTTGTITINGAEFDVAEVSAAEAAG